MAETNRKVFTPTLSLKADTPGAIAVEFATLNIIDLDQDVTVPGAFGEQSVRIQGFSHDTGDFSIGKGTIRESADKAVMDGLLNLEMMMGKEAYASLKFDLEHGEPLQEWSYIYSVLDADFGEFQGQQVRFLKRLKVHSVDPVFLGAGIGTRTTGVKSALTFLEHCEGIDEDVKTFLKRLGERMAIREQENRSLSAANIERLTGIAESLKAASIDLERALQSTEPNAASRLIQAQLQYERIRTSLIMAGSRGG